MEAKARGMFNPEHAVHGPEVGLPPPEEWVQEEREVLEGLPPEPFLTHECAQALVIASELRHDRPRVGGFGIEVGSYTASVERRLAWRGFEPGSTEFSFMEYLVALCIDEFLDRELERTVPSKGKEGDPPPPKDGMGQG